MTGRISEMSPTLVLTGDEYVEIIVQQPDGSWLNRRVKIRAIQKESGLSAYQIALLNGYAGTETEWLASLQGKSAYQIAASLGYNGTESQWLATLKGADGEDGVDGVNGKSAYELAVLSGFNGNQGDWLLSLKGETGLSAYELAVQGGFQGTAMQWLASLKGEQGVQGPAGVDGMSAYAIAVDQGFSGDLAAWLLSLKGEQGEPGTPGTNGVDGAPGTPGANGLDGADGLSAYQVAVQAGFVGDQAAWLASLQGEQGIPGTNGMDGLAGTNGLSAYEVAVGAGFVGTVEEWLASLDGTDGLPPARLGIYLGDQYGVVGGATTDESLNIMAAIVACGEAGGGLVLIKAANPGEPIYINSVIQIQYSHVTLQFLSPLLFGPGAMIRINGGFSEMIRTELGQFEQIKLRADATTDAEGRMVLPLRIGDATYLKLGDIVTLRGENDANGKALYKQTTTIIAINGNDATCADEPDYTFKAVYPDSAWPSDWTTGTTVAISVASLMSVDANRKDQIVNVQDATPFNIGDLVYISDSRTEADMMAPVVTNLRSSCVMEIARVVDKTATTLTLDRALKRQFLTSWKASVVKMDPIVNSHLKTRECSWGAPQPDRRNSALAINYGDRCTVECLGMNGKNGRKGIGIRIGYSYLSYVRNSVLNDAYSYESAEGYGIAIYYSTFCSAYNNTVTGCRHNFLFQTATSCDVLHNGSHDDWISGIDLHGANSVACRVLFNRVTRSNRHSPGVTNGGGIRNGNTSHTLGDHDTEIRGNYIEGYIGTGHAGIDISPSSNGVIVRTNTVVDSQIGIRHYNVGSGISPAQYTDRVIIDGNDLIRCVDPTYIRNWSNSVWSEVVLINNRSIGNTNHFKIEDIPLVTAFNNMIIAPVAAAGIYAFNFEDIATLRVFNNVAGFANRGVRVVNCGNAKVLRNFLSDVTETAYPIYQTGNGSFIEAGNGDTGGSGGGGTPVEFQTSATHIQWREVGAATWNDLVALDSLKGTNGVNGTNGTNGREVEFQTTPTHIQWRYVGDVSWLNLIALSDLVDAPTNPVYRHFVVPLGDSRSAQNWSYTNTIPALLARSPLFHMEQLSQRVRVISKWRQGVSGNEVEDIWARIQANTPNDAGIGPQDVPRGVTWFFLAGTNNATGAVDKAYMDNVLAVHKQIVEWAINRGDRVVVATEWPRVDGSTSGTLTTNELKMFLYYAECLKRQYIGMANVRTTDVWPEAVDPASATASAIANLLCPDGLHNSVGIAYLQGKKGAEVFEEWGDYPIIYRPTASNADLYDAALNPRGNLMPNPMLKGTGGSVPAGSGGSGVAPDSWTLDATSGLSVAGSRETIVFKGKTVDAFKMVISGTTTAQGAYARLRKSGLISAAVINDVLEAGCEFVVDAGHVNFGSVGLVIDPGVTANQVHGGVTLGGTNGDNPMPASLVEKYYACPRTPQYPVPDPLPSSLALDIRVRFPGNGIASSATIWLISSSFRKAPADG